MAAGQIRAFVALIVAFTFGVLQVLCACLPANAQLPSDASDSVHASTTHQAHTTTEGTHALDMGNMDATMSMPSGHCDPDPEEHDHVENCGHCDGFDALSASSEVPASPSAELTPPIAAIIPTTIPTVRRAGMAETNLSGLRWRDPPRSSPVDLKTLALI